MNSDYIVVSEAWRDQHDGFQKGPNRVGVALKKTGEFIVAANTRNEFAELFNGGEPVVSVALTDIALSSLDNERFLILSQTALAYAKSISNKIARLNVPGSVAEWSQIITHPTDGRVALHFSGQYLYVHTAANRDELPDVLSPIVPASEKNKMRTDIDANRGKPVLIHQFLPASAQARLKTKAEMAADGWF